MCAAVVLEARRCRRRLPGSATREAASWRSWQMRPKIFFITLAVADLARSVAFFRDGLGWPTDGIVGQQFHDDTTGADGTIAFFALDDGLLLGLYERSNLAK